MRIIFLIVIKELKQVFRNKAMLPLLTILPIVQLILLSMAATNEVKNISLAIKDDDHSSYSRLLLDKMTASGYFVLTDNVVSEEQGQYLLESEKADLILNIPVNFERDLLKNKAASVQIQVNAINGSKGGLAGAYAGQVIGQFNREILADDIGAMVKIKEMPKFDITYSNWYNPHLNYKVFMVPGILGTIVTILAMILTAMNVVREREMGTIEQINVTPIRKYEFIIGKLLPFLLIGLVDLAIGLAAGKLLFDIPMLGSLWLVFAFCVLNLTAVLGVGLLISTTSDTQQQAMFVAWFFMMIFILLGGLFTPLESMPRWAQFINTPNPIAHFVEVMRKVLLKGSGWADVRYHFIVMAVLSVVINTFAVWTYRKTV